MKTYEDAEKYAVSLQCNSLIMQGDDGEFHVIVGLFDHWKKKLKTVAEVTVQMNVKKITNSQD